MYRTFSTAISKAYYAEGTDLAMAKTRDLNMPRIGALLTGEPDNFGRQKGHTERYRSAEHTVDSQSRTIIEIAVGADQSLINYAKRFKV